MKVGHIIIGMVVVFVIWAAATIYAVVSTGKLIDKSGGLKGISERIWEGKKEVK